MLHVGPFAAAQSVPTTAPPSASEASASEAPSEPVTAPFTAAQVAVWRKKAIELSQLPERTPNGWSKSPIEPARILTVFSKLRVREGYVLRAYVFKEDGNSSGFVWALPADAEFQSPEDCPRLESHFLKPPKPFDALDDFMEAVAGDDSPESYLQASILRRELKEFAAGWHGVKWGMQNVLDDDPWRARPAESPEETSPFLYPRSERGQWKWRAPKPVSWRPEVRFEAGKAIVTYHTYTALYEEGEGDEIEKERIIRHVETYRRGKYRPLVSETKLAEGPDAIAH